MNLDKLCRIKIFSSFCDCNHIKNSLENTLIKFPDFYGIDKKYYIVDNNDNNYNYIILINKPMPNINNIPRENIIGLAYEPIPFLGLNNEFVEYAKKYIGKYFIGDKLDLPEPFTEHFGYMTYSICRTPFNIKKTKLMSIILSKKKKAPGHIYRHKLVENIINLNLPIDIFGRGSNQYKNNLNNDRIKGIFNDDAEPYEDYLFSICIENFISNHYFSEKIMSPLMFGCNPIYLGCVNIENYVENIIKLTGNIENDIKIIIEIINNPNLYYKNTLTEKNIKNINLIENLPNIFPI